MSGLDGTSLSNQIPESPNKLFVGGLPSYFSDDQVKELLQTIGELRALHVVRDGAASSKGYAFFEYLDSAHTPLAIESLNGLEVGDRKLLVQRAAAGRSGVTSSVTSSGDPFSSSGSAAAATRVLLLLNMVTEAELADPAEYDDIVADVREECGRFGHVMNVLVPRPGERDVGRVMVEFGDEEGAKKAHAALAGRTFAGRVVVASFFSELEFADRVDRRR